MPLSITRFTTTAFTGALARQPDGTELSTWTSALNAVVERPSSLLTEARSRVGGLFESSEYVARARTDSQFVSDLYLSFFGHVADEAGQAFWEDRVADDGRAAVLNAFKVSTEFIARVASLFAEPSTDVPPFPVQALGGPRPSKRRALPPDYKSLIAKHTFEDKGISVLSVGDIPILRWEEDYSDSVLWEWEKDIILDHYKAARHDELSFDYIDPDGNLQTGVRYESFETDLEKTWIHKAKVVLVKWPN